MVDFMLIHNLCQMEGEGPGNEGMGQERGKKKMCWPSVVRVRRSLFVRCGKGGEGNKKEKMGSQDREEMEGANECACPLRMVAHRG